MIHQGPAKQTRIRVKATQACPSRDLPGGLWGVARARLQEHEAALPEGVFGLVDIASPPALRKLHSHSKGADLQPKEEPPSTDLLCCCDRLVLLVFM